MNGGLQMGHRPTPEPRIGSLAVERGYLRTFELRRCVRAQAKLRKVGVVIRIGQVMIHRDLISTSQLVELLQLQRERRQRPPLADSAV
jgi:hypothetical protein